MSSFLFLQERRACLVRLIWMVLEMEGWWLYSYCLVGWCFQDLFSIACRILMQLRSSLFCFFYKRLVSVHVVHPCSSMYMTLLGKNCVLFYWLYLTFIWMITYAFPSCLLMSFSVDEALLPRKVNLSFNFRDPRFSAEMSPFRLKLMHSVLYLSSMIIYKKSILFNVLLYIYIYI